MGRGLSSQDRRVRLKIYRAPTAAEAIGKIRTELGADALILNTRRVADGVEITAALEPREPPRIPPPEPNAVAALQFHGVPEALAQRLSGVSLRGALAAQLGFEALPLQRGGPPLLLAGPPGAGKTLTVARLATRLVMNGTTPLVVTADGRRAGATEQLAAFTRLLGLNLVVASHPVALARAIAARAEGAPALVDLPGSDPFLAQEREELSLLAATAAGRLVAVLPAGLDPAEAADLAAAYAEAGARLLVATRLDLARRIGGVLAAADAGLALAEAGISPGAADGLVPLTPDLLAGRLLRVPHDHRAERYA
jgi:flagellar biosynthesis protein FlhF